MAKRPLSDTSEIVVENVATLLAWLLNHHSQTDGVWLVTYKKADPDRHIPYPDIVDQCLCFGWVDSLPRAKDTMRSMIYISPRKPCSNWSRINKDKVARLTDEGLMAPAGMAVVERAKKDGSWSALDDVENLVIPDDLQAAFDAKPGAEDNWQAFPRSVKRGALEIVLNAKRAPTRAAKIETIVSDSAEGRRPFQWRKS